MFRWRCVVEGSTSGFGTGGTGNRATRIPVLLSRPPRMPPSANDNRPPRWLRIVRAGFVLGLAALALVWLRM